MNAYDVLKRDHIPKQIDEKYFNQLIKEFKESYFKEHNYFERLSNHRKPLELINELLNGVHSNDGLNILLQKIQNRSELRHIETNISTYVPHKLRDIWMNDRGLKTCYSAIKEYCKFWSKDFNTIAIHIAEYKAMLQVFKILERARKKNWVEPRKDIDLYRRNNFEKVEAIGALMHEEKSKSKKTLQSILSQEQLKKLYKLLIEDKYIIRTKENDFIYFFSGKPLSDIPKIHWDKSKKLAVNLLDNICVNFSFPVANNCIKTNHKKLDSNDRPKRDFNEIIVLLKRIR